MNLEQLKYPIGLYTTPEVIDQNTINDWIDTIAEFPKTIKNITSDLSVEELNWQYRPEGWTIKQVIHHCADSHMNAYIRFKLSATEDTPTITIRPYFEDRWAKLEDATDNNIQDSLLLMEGLHNRWSKFLKTLTKDHLKLKFTHPEYSTQFTLEDTIGNYAWHCNHHLAHIQQALKFKGDF